jgi:hypothetical protein
MALGICSVCSSVCEVQRHHFSPKALFEDADRWPVAPLCRKCHKRWHDLVAPMHSLRRGKRSFSTSSWWVSVTKLEYPGRNEVRSWAVEFGGTRKPREKAGIWCRNFRQHFCSGKNPEYWANIRHPSQSRGGAEPTTPEMLYEQFVFDWDEDEAIAWGSNGWS